MSERNENHEHKFDFKVSAYGCIEWKCKICGTDIEELEDSQP